MMKNEESMRADLVEDKKSHHEDDAHFVTECGLTRGELRELVAEMIG